MNSKSKIILANVFALAAVVIILAATNILGLPIGKSPNALIPNTFLILVPQMGFFYLYWMSYKKRKALG